MKRHQPHELRQLLDKALSRASDPGEFTFALLRELIVALYTQGSIGEDQLQRILERTEQ
jgi:hypothetical protein